MDAEVENVKGGRGRVEYGKVTGRGGSVRRKGLMRFGEGRKLE